MARMCTKQIICAAIIAMVAVLYGGGVLRAQGGDYVEPPKIGIWGSVGTDLHDLSFMAGFRYTQFGLCVNMLANQDALPSNAIDTMIIGDLTTTHLYRGRRYGAHVVYGSWATPSLFAYTGLGIQLDGSYTAYDVSSTTGKIYRNRNADKDGDLGFSAGAGIQFLFTDHAGLGISYFNAFGVSLDVVIGF